MIIKDPGALIRSFDRDMPLSDNESDWLAYALADALPAGSGCVDDSEEAIWRQSGPNIVITLWGCSVCEVVGFDCGAHD
jgi:hypothetical protein